MDRPRNLLVDCATTNCHIGADFLTSNSVVNTMLSCAMSGATSVRSSVPVQVIGGEFGLENSTREIATMSSVSRLRADTATTAGFRQFTFTAAIQSPGPRAPGQEWRIGVYDSFVIDLPSYMLVPLTIDSFNVRTGIVTFRLWLPWLKNFYYRQNDTRLDTDTNFNTELQACATVYAFQRGIMFEGPINVEGIHYEQPTTVVTLMHANQSAVWPSKIVNSRANDRISKSQYSGTSDSNLCLWYGQQAFPYIHQDGGKIIVRDCIFQNDVTNDTDSVVFDLAGQGSDFIFENSDIVAPNIRRSARPDIYSPPMSEWDENFPPISIGVGKFNSPYFGYHVKNDATVDPPAIDFAMRRGSFSTRYEGYFAAPGAVPRTTTNYLGSLTPDFSLSSLPTRRDGSRFSPLMPGHVPHLVSQPGTLQYLLAKHAGESTNYTYGADFAVTWSIRDATFFLSVGGAYKSWLTPGLKLLLDNGLGPRSYVVTGVYKTLGYVTIHQLTDPNRSAYLAKSRGALDSGKTIGQERFQLQKFARQCDFAPSLGAVAGYTYNQGDIIYKSPVNRGDPLGWVCTAGGIAGSTAAFGVLPPTGVDEILNMTSNFTLDYTFNGQIVVVNSSSTVTVTLPNDLSPPFTCRICQEGSAAVVFSAASGATARSTIGPNARTSAQYGEVMVKVISNDSGSSAHYRLTGDVAA